MPSVNKVLLIGNLTRDPEIRQTNGGSMVASFTLAMSRKYTNARQELVDEACFVDVSAFQRNAEIIQQFVHKGDPLYIEGRLRYDTWDDRTTGAKRSKLSVVCESLQLLTRRPTDGAVPVVPASAPAVGFRPSIRPQYAGASAPAAPQYGAPAPQYAVPQQPAYDPQPAPPSQYRSAAPMPSFQASEEPAEAPQDGAVDDIPF